MMLDSAKSSQEYSSSVLRYMPVAFKVNEEAKATEKKTTKEVDELNTKGWDYQDPKLFNNINPDQLVNGVAIEIRKDNSMPLEKAMEIVVKQLGKDPMYYIKNGLGPRWRWLGALFALFGALAGFGLANTVQSNAVSQVLLQSYGVPTLSSGIVMALLVAVVLLGGITRIADVAGKLVPLMAMIYLLSSAAILCLNYAAVPAAFVLIVDSAFNGAAAAGGFSGATIALALRMGVARGIFSNEAGLGSAPIAHAAAVTNSPVRQGTIAMLGTFIDTLVVCSMTGMVLIVSGVWNGDQAGAAMTLSAFDANLPFGGDILTLCIVLFAFTTMLGWSYYGERCAEFLCGPRVVVPFRVLWILGVFAGTQLSLGLVWKISDALNGLMAFPNLIALVLLAPVVFKLTREYHADTSLSEVVSQ